MTAQYAQHNHHSNNSNGINGINNNNNNNSNNNNNGSASSSSAAAAMPSARVVVSNGIHGPVLNGQTHHHNGAAPTTSATTATSHTTSGNANGISSSQSSRAQSHHPSRSNPNPNPNNPNPNPEDDQSDTDERRPSSAPGYKNRNSLSVVTSHEPSSGPDRSRRPAKPLLLRSKSEYLMRQQDDMGSSSPDEEIPEWGARHGFEDHYQSDIVSQLANVRFLVFVLCSWCGWSICAAFLCIRRSLGLAYMTGLTILECFMTHVALSYAPHYTISRYQRYHEHSRAFKRLAFSACLLQLLFFRPPLIYYLSRAGICTSLIGGMRRRDNLNSPIMRLRTGACGIA